VARPSLRRASMYALLFLGAMIAAAAVYVVAPFFESGEALVEWYSAPGNLIDDGLRRFGWYANLLSWLGRLGGNAVFLDMAVSTHLVFGIVFLYAIIFWAALITFAVFLVRTRWPRGRASAL
jgi:hypothetical protein